MEFIKSLKENALKNQIEYINCIPIKKMDGYSSVIVALIPYYAGEQESYLSKYTRGMDYHKVGRNLLERIIKQTSEIIEYEILIDVSPLDEVSLACQAGLGVRGKNNLLINEKYGSFVFILTALTNQEVEEFKAEEEKCMECGICAKRCPFGAIGDTGIDYQKCISNINQKRQIDSKEAEMIQNAGFAWGCDLCQNDCPHNQNIPITPILEFKEKLLTSLYDIDRLSNKEFKEKYQHYSLAYKGKKILQRNINLINHTNN